MKLRTVCRLMAGYLFASTVAGAGGALAQDGAATGPTPQEIVSQWIGGIGSLDFVTVDGGRIEHDDAEGVTTVSGLEITLEIEPGMFAPEGESAGIGGRGEYAVWLPEIRFTDLASDGESYSAAAIEFEDAVVDSYFEGEGQPSVESVTRFTEYAVYDARWSKLPEIGEDAAHQVSRFYPLAAALLDFDFSAAELGPIVTTARSSESEGRTSVVYGPSEFGEAVAGDISAARIDSFSMSLSGLDSADAPFDMRVAAGPIRVEDYNYGSFIRSFAPDAAASGQDYATWLGLLNVPDIRISGENDSGDWFEAAVDDIVLEDVGVRPPSIPVLTRVDEFIVAEEAGTEPSEEEVVQLVASVYAAMRLGRFEVAGIDFSAVDDVAGSVDAIRVRNLSAEGLGEYSTEGVRIQGPGGISVALARSAVEDVTFPSLSALVGFPEAQEKGDIQTMLAAIPTVGRLLYSGLEMNVPGEAEISLGEALIEMADHIGPIPTRLALAVEDLRMPVAQLAEEPRIQLQALGYDQIAGSMRFDADWDAANENIRLALSAMLEDGGSLVAEALVGGIRRDYFENPMAAPMMAMTTTTFDGASARFENDSIRDRALNRIAEMQGANPETLKQMAVGGAAILLSQLNRPQLTEMVTGALEQFFKGDGDLLVKSQPDEPLPVLQMMTGAQSDPGALADSLNLDFDAR